MRIFLFAVLICFWRVNPMRALQIVGEEILISLSLEMDAGQLLLSLDFSPCVLRHRDAMLNE